MVLLTIKSNDDKLFVFETQLGTRVEKVLGEVIRLRNGIEKIRRLSEEVKDLIEHGVSWPPERRGLLPEQAAELRLDPNPQLAKRYTQRSSSSNLNPDPRLKRSGLAVSDTESARILSESSTAAQNLLQSEPLKWEHIKEGLEIVRGAIQIVYPEGIPSFDPVQMELDNTEEVEASTVWDPTMMCLWFASKPLADSELLSTYLGKNEKCKCIVKVSQRGQGPPPKEKPFTEEQEKQLLLEQHRRREVLRKLAKEQDESPSTWAGNGDALKNKFNGMDNISWKTGFK